MNGTTAGNHDFARQRENVSDATRDPEIRPGRPGPGRPGPVCWRRPRCPPQRPPEGLQLVDLATRLVQTEQIKSAGYARALGCVSELRPGATFDFKPVTREFADRLRALGRHVVSCYQFDKPGWPRSPSDFTRGA